MSCNHGLTQIVVENDMVFKETRKITPCPICMIEELDKYFTSGNDIPVERATILAKDYWKIRGIK